jgi:hypothetical protein
MHIHWLLHEIYIWVSSNHVLVVFLGLVMEYIYFYFFIFFILNIFIYIPTHTYIFIWRFYL